MKKNLFAIIAILFLTTTTLSAQWSNWDSGQEGRFSVAGNINYGGAKDLIGFGLRAQYGFAERIRTSFEYKYYLDRRDWSEWQVNVDFHYMLEASNTVWLYPLVGARLSRWTEDSGRSGNVPEEFRFKHSMSKIGLNLGFGGQVQLANHIYLQLEPKYELNKKGLRQFSASVGIMYEF